ncbi:MAG: hypothetical protein A2Y33_01965 [Spirochaetes bacterium GWF1_51_8]|nr:MAG: hypothetical protein A2Y33_01965 [Spirochaetes bacterium GWF1_51_8]
MFGIEFTAVNPKVRNWMSFLLKPEDMEYLVGASLNEVIETIRAKAKKESIETGDIREIEQILKNAIVQYIHSGLNFLVGKPADFLQTWLEVYRIENLKTIARALITGKPVDFLYKIKDKDWLTMDSVKDVRSFDEYLEFLRRTDYYTIAQKAFPRIVEEKNTFFWEIALDNQYAHLLKKAAQKLSRPSRDAVKRLLFFSMEASRFQWIFRMRFQYGLSVEETITFIPNVYKSLSKRGYAELLESESPAAFFEKLHQRGIIEEMVTDASSFEKLMNDAIVKRTHRYLGGIPFQFGIFLSFIILKSMDVRKYIILLEGKRAGVDRAILEKLLI